MARSLTPVLARLYLALILIFLYLPIVMMMVMAFNSSPLYEFPFEFSLIWFKALAGNERLLASGLNSVLIALANTLVATALGTMAALGLNRYEFRARPLLELLLLPPITIPWLIIGVSMLIFFYWTGIGRGLHSILLGHVRCLCPMSLLSLARA